MEFFPKFDFNRLPVVVDDGGEGDDIGVYNLITALSRRLISNENAHVEKRDALRRKLRRIAFSHLLRATPTDTKEYGDLVEDIPMALLSVIAAKRLANDDWSDEEHNRVDELVDRYEAVASNQPLSWPLDIGRFLISLALLQGPDQVTSKPKKKSNFFPDTEDLSGIHVIPEVYFPTITRFSTNYCDRDVPLLNFFWPTKETLDKQKFPELESFFTSTYAKIKFLDDKKEKGFSRSASRNDEGFSSPSQPQHMEKLPFDWGSVPISPRNKFMDWDKFYGITFNEKSLHLPNCGYKEIRELLEHSPCNLVKVPQSEFMECVRALMIGVASHLFDEVIGGFTMIPGLYTDSIPPWIMYMYCQHLRIAGKLYSNLQSLSTSYPSITSATMEVKVKNVLLAYHNWVGSIEDTKNLAELIIESQPFVEMMEYLVELLSREMNSFELLNTLFAHVLHEADPFILCLSTGLFIDCCDAYFRLVDKWVFEGLWHKDLFVRQFDPPVMIEDRYTWLNAFTFLRDQVPSFLPGRKIFECGRMLYLAGDEDVSEKVDRMDIGMIRDCRPHTALVSDMKGYDLMKQVCKYYSRTGEEIREAAFSALKKDDYVDILSAALDKAVLDLSNFNEECAVKQEKELHSKIEKVRLMREELRRFEEHGSIKRLTSCITELLEEDRIAFYELQQIISCISNRYECVEQFVKQAELNNKKLMLNNWKERRYNLNTLRKEYSEKNINSDLASEESFSSYASCNLLAESTPFFKPFTLRSQKTFESLSRASSTPADVCDESSVYISFNSGGDVVPGFASHSGENVSPGINFATPAGDSLKQMSPSVISSTEIDSFVEAEEEEILNRQGTPVLEGALACQTAKLVLEGEQSGNHVHEQLVQTEKTSKQCVSTEQECLKGHKKIHFLAENLDDPLFSASQETQPSNTTQEGQSRGVTETNETAEQQSDIGPELYFPDHFTPSNSPPLTKFERIKPVNVWSSGEKSCNIRRLYNHMQSDYLSRVDHDSLKPFDYIHDYYSQKNTGESEEHDDDGKQIDVFNKSHLKHFLATSIETPLKAHSRVVNNVALHRLFVENDLLGHFKRMKNIFLRYDGVSAQMLTATMSTCMERENPPNLMVYTKLQNILRTTLQADSKYVSYTIIRTPRAFDTSDPKVHNCLMLHYETNWPLNLIVPNMALIRYNQLFNFLFSIDQTYWYLQKAFQFLLVKYSDMKGEHYAQIQLHRHIMVVFVNALKLYCGTTVTHCWNTLCNGLITVDTPEQIYRIHARYLNDIQQKFMLCKKTKRFQDYLTKIFHYILVYCQTLMHSNWVVSDTGLWSHTKYKKLVHTFENFMEMWSLTRKLIDYYIREHGYIDLKVLSHLLEC